MIDCAAMHSDAQLTLDIEREIAAVDEWVRAFPHERLRKARKALLVQRAELDSKIDELDRRLAVYESLRVPASNGKRDPEPVAPSRRRVTPRRAAFYRILEQDSEREIPLGEIKDRLVALGHMEDTERERHSLQVMASKMVKRGEVQRPRDGFYKFRPPHGESVEASSPVSPATSGNEEAVEDGEAAFQRLPRPAQEGAPDVAHRAGS